MKDRLLNPLADPVFKRIFGEEKKLLISLINATIRPPDPVVEIEYFQPELVPYQGYDKVTIVDVRCMDANRRHFIVEMQVNPQQFFMQRVLYNTAKVFSRQLIVGEKFDLLQPVYCLSLLNHVIDPEKIEWIHQYELTHQNDPQNKMKGMHLFFIELPKFRKLVKFDVADPLHCWMKFFIEPEYFTTMPPKKYETFEELKQAIELLHESAFTEEQLWAYDRYWDAIRTRQAEDDYRDQKSKEEGLKMGIEEGKLIGVETTLNVIQTLKENHLSDEEIAMKFQLTPEMVTQIKNYT
jgi:predicted transposase/invertase (TIGR01784 family)